MLATFVLGGLGLIYAPAQVTDPDSAQAQWGDWVVRLGILMVVGASLWFAGAHICWPRFVRRLQHLRLYYCDAPNPNQPLLDAIDGQRRSPGTFLKALRQFVVRWDLEAKRPYVMLRVEYFWGGVPTLKVMSATGYPKVFGERCADAVFDENQTWHSAPSGHAWFVTVTIYFDAAFTAQVHDALKREPFTAISISDVRLRIQADGGPEVAMALGDGTDRFALPS